MKRYMILPVLILSVKAVFSQATANSVSMSQEFNQLASSAKVGYHNDFSFFQTYSSSLVDGNQFFLSDWSKGEILTNKNDVFNQGLLFAYDKVRQELFIRQKDSSVVLIGNKEDIKSFKLKDAGNVYEFVNSTIYTDVKPAFFYQVLVADSSRFTLLKYNKTRFVKADKNDMMKEKEGKVYDAFVDDYTYYIVKGKSGPVPVQLKAKAVRKVFTDLGANPDKYMNDHSGSIDEDYLVGMVTELNN